NPAISTVSRQPQTTPTATGAGAPFIRSSRKSEIQGFIASGIAAGGSVNLPLKAAGGYLRGLLIKVVASGGTGTAAVASADGPWACIQSLLFKDPSGTPVVQVDGYGLY